MCDTEIAIIMFGPDGELAQFSSTTMESTLRQYGRCCTEPHESHTPSSLKRRLADRNARGRNDTGMPSGIPRGIAAPKRRRMAPTNDDGDGTDTAEALMSMQRLPPNLERKVKADEHVDRELDRLVEERMRRAQQGGHGGSSDLVDFALAAAAAMASPSAIIPRDVLAVPDDAGIEPTGGVHGDGSTSAAAAAAAPEEAPAGTILAINSLAAALAGDSISPGMAAVKPEPQGTARGSDGEGEAPSILKGQQHLGISLADNDKCSGSPSESPRPDCTVDTVDTPAVTVTPPVAGSAEASGLLGPQQGAHAADAEKVVDEKESQND